MSEANWKKIVRFFTENPIRVTKELLCFVTINPYKKSPLFKSWQRVSKCSDYLRKYSRVVFVVKGVNKVDKSAHYHAICYLHPVDIPKIKSSKVFNVDIKEWSCLKVNDVQFSSFEDEYDEANDELAEKYSSSGETYTQVDVLMRVGYLRCLRDLMLKKPRLDKFVLEDLSKYCVKNLKETLKESSPEEWVLYETFVMFPSLKDKEPLPPSPPKLVRSNNVVDFGELINIIKK